MPQLLCVFLLVAAIFSVRSHSRNNPTSVVPSTTKTPIPYVYDSNASRDLVHPTDPTPSLSLSRDITDNFYNICVRNVEPYLELLQEHGKLTLKDVRTALNPYEEGNMFKNLYSALESVFYNIAAIKGGDSVECKITEQLASCLSTIHDAMRKTQSCTVRKDTWKMVGLIKTAQTIAFDKRGKCVSNRAADLLKRIAGKLKNACLPNSHVFAFV